MRRLNHLANYVQAPIIVGKHMQQDKALLNDPNVTDRKVGTIRKVLAELGAQITQDDETYRDCDRKLESGAFA